MLDLGFEPHIRAIASETRADRQTLMFSATWPPAIQKLASEFMAEPTRVTVGSQDLSASHSVKQVRPLPASRTCAHSREGRCTPCACSWNLNTPMGAGHAGGMAHRGVLSAVESTMLSACLLGACGVAGGSMQAAGSMTNDPDIITFRAIGHLEVCTCAVSCLALLRGGARAHRWWRCWIRR